MVWWCFSTIWGEVFESNGVVTPLRRRWIEYGWSTLMLSIDMPFNTNVMLSASLEQKLEVGSEESESVNDEEMVLHKMICHRYLT